MIAPACTHPRLLKHGKDRKGQQRWKCADCGQTVTRDDHVRPLGDMRIDADKALEGTSIRACERITGVKRDTICDMILQVGQQCEQFLLRTIKGVQAKFIEMDELWAFIGCKAKTAALKNKGDDMGDSWTWLAIDADT